MRNRLLTLLFLFIIVFLGVQATRTNSAEFDEPVPIRTPLVLYGEYVFLRENCLECHTLRDENATEERTSLDGYSGKRSAGWLYYFFIDPNSVHPFNHPTLKLLTKKTMSESIIEELFQSNQHFASDQEDDFLTQLKDQSDSITQKVKKGIYLSSDQSGLIDQSEMIALIAFLQQIPYTPNRQKYEDEQHRQYEERIRLNELIYANPDSLFQSVTSEPNAISAGNVLFKKNCIPCHGENAQGWIGPNLTDTSWIYDNSRNKMLHLIAYGSETHKMPEHSSKLKPNEIAQIVLFLESIREDEH